ncbi:MAG: glycosyltransferase family 4 protein [bacterium]|nr:glycosyltransferase family 4 protein [bacterium]
MSERINVLEISECFPNQYKPVTGEFILQHVKALSEFCNVTAAVPLRYIPSKELVSFNPFRSISNISRWMSSLSATKNSNEKNLKIVYSGYISLPRPYFEFIDNYIVNFFFYKKLKRIFVDSKPDIIYCNWIRPWAELCIKLAKEFSVPLIIDHHEDIPTLKKLYPNSYKQFLKVFENADAVVIHSTVNKNELKSESLKLPEVYVNYLGQNFDINADAKKFSIGKTKLVCVSHLYERRKNIDVLIKALSLIVSKENFELTIAGEGNLKNEYIALSRSLSLDNIIKFTGERSQQEVGSILEESDIFILPSYPEAFGIVFIEALAKGLPVITCEGNGGGEELKSLGYPVILVKPDSPEELSGAIDRLCRDHGLMNKMSESGKEVVRNNFTWKKNAERTAGVLEAVINKFKERK